MVLEDEALRCIPLVASVGLVKPPSTGKGTGTGTGTLGDLWKGRGEKIIR